MQFRHIQLSIVLFCTSMNKEQKQNNYLQLFIYKLYD